ncbi:hypothetical protein HY993_00905 [Candidatus Micrarchaeota archaeon]|nr:hypothetical protein [Candidatus Micrarchaeota archaeon]
MWSQAGCFGQKYGGCVIKWRVFRSSWKKHGEYNALAQTQLRPHFEEAFKQSGLGGLDESKRRVVRTACFKHFASLLAARDNLAEIEAQIDSLEDAKKPEEVLPAAAAKATRRSKTRNSTYPAKQRENLLSLRAEATTRFRVFLNHPDSIEKHVGSQEAARFFWKKLAALRSAAVQAPKKP